MATRTVVCPDCEEPLPYSRLSCGNCGTLLASVAGAPPRSGPLRTVTLDEPAWLSDESDLNWPADAGSLSPEALGEPEPEPEPAPDPEPEPDVVPDPQASPDVEPVPDAEVADSADVVSDPAPDFQPDPAPGSSPDDVPAGAPADLDDAAEPPPDDIVPARAQLGRWTPDDRTAAPPMPTGPVLRPSYASRTRLDVAAPPPTYVRPADGSATAPPAGSWLPPAPDPLGGATGSQTAGSANAATTLRPGPGESPLLADLPFDAPNDLAGWLVAAGSAIATLGFLLPWADVMPFATGGLGYMDRWGLAVPSHVFVFLASAIVLGLAVVPNRLPAWTRSGLLPLVLGGLLMGLAWPYVLGGFGSHIGSLAIDVAALLLLVGGFVAIRATRHPEARPGV